MALSPKELKKMTNIVFESTHKPIKEAAALPKATDASSGYHGPSGYPQIDIPPKFMNLISTTLGKNSLLKAQKSQDAWIFQVSTDRFDLKDRDFKEYVSFGLYGIRFERPNSILLYFKH